MAIKKLIIKNYKSIEDAEIDFSRHINVLIGENGAGKSSVLEAIAILFSWMNSRLRSNTAKGMHIDTKDITFGKSSVELQVVLDNDEQTSWSLVKSNARTGRESAKSDLSELNALVAKVLSDQAMSEHLPAFVSFYDVHRSLVQVPAKLHMPKSKATEELYGAEAVQGTDFNSFFKWYKAREDEENELIRFEGAQTSRDLDIVREAISRFFPQYSNLRMRRTSPKGLTIEKNGCQIFLNKLSDGEKCYISLIADIARKMAVYDRYFKNAGLSDPLSVPAIVVIDEVELHLHPKWQLEILPKLKSVFPNTQFIVSTHSPHIVVNVDTHQDNLVVMKGGRAVVSSDPVYGRQVQDLLLELFGMSTLRNSDVQEKIDSLWQLLKQNICSGEQFEKEYKALQDMLPPEDLEFVRIKAQVAFMNKGAER